IWLLFCALCLLVGSFRAMWGGWQLWGDWVVYRRVRPQRITERRQIAHDLHRLQTNRFRLKYVRAIAEAGNKPSDAWPEGADPFYRNDRAATLLAQLEEKWLGLDR